MAHLHAVEAAAVCFAGVQHQSILQWQQTQHPNCPWPQCVPHATPTVCACCQCGCVSDARGVAGAPLPPNNCACPPCPTLRLLLLVRAGIRPGSLVYPVVDLRAGAVKLTFEDSLGVVASGGIFSPSMSPSPSRHVEHPMHFPASTLGMDADTQGTAVPHLRWHTAYGSSLLPCSQ